METVAPEHLKDFLLIIIALGGFAYGLWRGMRKESREIHPQPLEVKVGEALVTKTDLEKHTEENRRDRDRLYDHIDEREDMRRAEMERLRLEIKSDVANGITAGEQRTQEITKRLNLLAEEFPHKVIALLKTTGVIES
jgi:hypothetical protein